MGQYWIPVNLDKEEFVDPHKLGTGLKLWEQLANHPGTGAALIILQAAMPEVRGGGDLDLGENRHGNGDMPPDYPAIAKMIIGRWVGDRVVLIGDYAEKGDVPGYEFPEYLYDKCRNGRFDDISELVARVIAHELGGKFVGEGWRDFVTEG